jgi:hypothetical protein
MYACMYKCVCVCVCVSYLNVYVLQVHNLEYTCWDKAQIFLVTLLGRFLVVYCNSNGWGL